MYYEGNDVNSDNNDAFFMFDNFGYARVGNVFDIISETRKCYLLLFRYISVSSGDNYMYVSHELLRLNVKIRLFVTVH